MLDLSAASLLAKGDTVHVLSRLDGGIRIREVESASGAALTDAPGATSSDGDNAKQLEPGATCLRAKGDTVHAVGGLDGGIGHRDGSSASGAGRADAGPGSEADDSDQEEGGDAEEEHAQMDNHATSAYLLPTPDDWESAYDDAGSRRERSSSLDECAVTGTQPPLAERLQVPRKTPPLVLSLIHI